MRPLKIKLDHGRRTELVLEVGENTIDINIEYIDLKCECGCYLTVKQARRLHDYLGEWLDEQDSQ